MMNSDEVAAGVEMIRFEGVDVRFGDNRVIAGLDLAVQEGEFFTLLGPSGCGKTTALRTLAGFVEPSAGDVYIDGKRATKLPSEKRRVGMVFQNYALFPSMTVRENIAFGLTVQKVSKAETEERVTAIADQVRLQPEQLDKSVAELSGGQQQRVAIARALVLRPRILLLDEPLSNLDAKLRIQLREQLKALQSEVGITTVYVTHDQEEALTMSDRIAVFNRGLVEQVGTPEEIYDSSATEFVATFIGETNRLSHELVSVIDSLSGRGLRLNAASYVRPEKIRLRRASAASASVELEGVVRSRAYHGSYTMYTLECQGTELRAMINEADDDRRDVGDVTPVSLDPAWILQYES